MSHHDVLCPYPQTTWNFWTDNSTLGWAYLKLLNEILKIIFGRRKIENFDEICMTILDFDSSLIILDAFFIFQPAMELLEQEDFSSNTCSVVGENGPD